MKKMHQKKQSPNTNLKQYLQPCISTIIMCVDERQTEKPYQNGVNIPGGIYGLVDEVKAITGVNEDEAWRMVINAGIPIGAHTDNHHGALGCGYAKLVEMDPSKVGAVESVPANERLSRVKRADGQILNYVGEHRPTHAVINFQEGVSLNQRQAWDNGLGVFNCDVWAVGQYAQKLGIDPAVMMQRMEKRYKKTVAALTGITHLQTFT